MKREFKNYKKGRACKALPSVMYTISMRSDIFDDPKNLTKAALYLVFLLIPLVVFFHGTEALYRSFSNDYSGSIAEGVDFNAYLTGAHILKSNPENLYDIQTQRKAQKDYFGKETEGTLTFRNTPVVAFFYIPYTFLFRDLAYKVSFIFQLILVLIFVIFLIKHFGYRKYLIPFLPLFLPVAIQAVMGQVVIIPSIAVLLSMIMLGKKKHFLSGVLLSFLLLKIQYVVIIPYFLIIVKKKKEFIYGLVAGLLALLFIDCLIYKGFYLPDYIRFLFVTEDPLMGTDMSKLLNFTSIFWNFGFGKDLILIVNLTIYLLSLVLVYLFSKRREVGVLISVAIIFSLALNFHVNAVDLIFLLIPMFYFSGKKDMMSVTAVILLFLIQFLTFLSRGWITGLVLLFIGVFLLLQQDFQKITSNREH